MAQVRALGLISGGLDSAIAVKLMLDQGIDVTVLHFKTAFSTDVFKHPEYGRITRSEALARYFKVPLKLVMLEEEYYRFIKHPPHDYGSALNPCMDCHTFFLKKAKAIMEKEGFDFVFTGEVMGQCPMSQLKDQLQYVERHSGMTGKVLRPLSAKLLTPTEAEEQGLVDREALLDISGRSRRVQMELADSWDLQFYSAPGGGCLLTEKDFGKRLEDLFDARHPGLPNTAEIELLKQGRQFRLTDGRKFIVGRTHMENGVLKNHAAKAGLWAAEPVGFPGPAIIIADPIAPDAGEPKPECIATAGALCMLYGKHNADAEPGAQSLRLYNPAAPRKGILYPLPDEIPWTKADLDSFRVDHPNKKIRRKGWPLD